MFGRRSVAARSPRAASQRIGGARQPPRRSAGRRAVLVVLTGVLVSAVTLAIIEVGARARGYAPRRLAVRPEPPIHAPDPVLGWRPLPGHYTFGPYSSEAAPVQVTVRPDGARDAGSGPARGRPQVLLVGCSFTFGWAVSDDQTWAWRLQELRPDVEVVNHGVGGYSTYQALLTLEDLLNRGAPPPARVLYGFIDHSLRNVAAPLWLWALSFNPHTIATPYCTLDPDAHLVRHPPEAYPSLPLHQELASVAAIESAVLQRRAGNRQRMAERVTKLLLDEMAALCRQHGVGFSLVVLSIPKHVEATYVSFAEQHGIDVIDCNQQPTIDEIVPGEAHPNRVVHHRWGDCIAAALAQPDRLPPR